jgi:hypothetical protein
MPALPALLPPLPDAPPVVPAVPPVVTLPALPPLPPLVRPPDPPVPLVPPDLAPDPPEVSGGSVVPLWQPTAGTSAAGKAIAAAQMKERAGRWFEKREVFGIFVVTAGPR